MTPKHEYKWFWRIGGNVTPNRDPITKITTIRVTKKG